METVELTATKVKCGGCAAAIRSGLEALPAVAEVEVDVASGRVTVRGEGLDPARLAARLAELGYPVAA
ncbi:MAG TPA: copper chaperone [Gammaproteobacteria bacterium]|nr:copper chaperone [Gammaproteobacteria bacterium]